MNFPPFPSKVEDLHNLLENSDFGTIDAHSFYRVFAPENGEFALIFLTDIYLSFLNRIHSIHIDATFKSTGRFLPATDYPLSCSGHNNIISGKTCLLYDAVS